MYFRVIGFAYGCVRLFRSRMRAVIHLHHVLHRKLRVALGGGEALMAEKFLNGAQIGALLEHVCAEGMAQGVWMDVRR